MLVKDIMIKKVVSVSPDNTVTEVADIIFKNKFHALPVVRNGKLVGIITEDDFFLKGFDDLYLPSYIQFLKGNKVVDDLPRNIKNKIKKLISATAKDLMSSPCLSVTPNTPVPKLMRMIRKTRFATWPVVDFRNKLVGIVTLADILGIFKGGTDEMSKAYRKNLGKTREVDLIAKDVQSFWEKTYVFINKTHIRTWKGVFLIAFISGAIAALFWTVSLRVHTKSGAQEKSAILSLVSGDENVKTDDPFNVDVMIDTRDNQVAATMVVVKYNPQEFKLEFWDTDDSVFHQEEGCVYSGKPCESVENRTAAGEIYIKMAKSKERVNTSSGKVANLVFRALKPTHPDSSNINIDFDSSGIYQAPGIFLGRKIPGNILSGVENATVNVSSQSCAKGLYCTE